MDTLKQTKLSKTKLITKRKVLSATMSGGLLMTSILVPTAYSLLEHQITAKADVLDIDLLSNVNSSNTSGTTAENRWTSESGAQNVNFTISGSTLAGASLLNGQRYAVLAVPQELRGFVSPNGNTTVNTNITVDLNQVALLNTLVSAGDTFLNSVTTLLDSNPLASLDLTEVTRQLNLLKSVQSIGGGNFSATTSIDGTGALISAQLDDGLGQVLAQNLTTILTNLKNAINALQATGLAATVVNTALLPLKATFTAAVDVVLNPLINGTGDILSQLLNASVLGDTSITIPTTITPPTLQGPLDARFVGTAVKSNFLDVSILSNANGVSYVYLDGTNSATLVAPTGNLEATTSASGATDATADLPTTLKDSTGADVSVTSIITGSTGATVTNGSLGAGTYTVTYSAAGYDDVTQTLIVSDPSTTATLVAPTGNLEATTSASGGTDATADLPTTLKDSTGADVPVSSIITDSTGATVTNGSLGAGTYTVTYSAAGYDDVTQTLIVSDPADTTAPNAPVVTEVSGNSQIGYTVKGTAEPNAIVTIYDDANNQVGTAQANASGEFTVTLAGEIGPSSLLSITATDSSGNISDSANFNTPGDPIPGAPTATASGDSTNGYTVSGNAEANSTVTIKDLDGNILGTTVANDDGSYSVALPVGPRPEQTLEATATNSFGESSSTTFVTPMDPSLNAPSGTLTATTTAPGASDANAPILTELTDSNGNTVSVTAIIRDSEGEIVVNGQLAAGSYTVTYSAPGYADVTQILEVTDAPDTTAPEAPTVGGVTGNSTDGYVVSGTGEAGSTITIKDDAGNTVGTGTVDSEGNYSIEVPGSVGPDAPLTVTATDNSGNTSQPTSTTTPSDPDTTAPQAPKVTSVSGNSGKGYTIKGKAEAGALVNVYDNDNNLLGSVRADSNGSFTIVLPKGSVGANQPLSLTATDKSGNTSGKAYSVTPADQVIAPPSAVATGSSSKGYTISGYAGKEYAGGTVTIVVPAPQSKLFRANLALPGQVLGVATIDANGNYVLIVEPGAAYALEDLQAYTTYDGLVSVMTNFTTPADPTDTGGNTGNGNNNGNNAGTGGEGTGTGQPGVSDGSNGATSGQTGNGNGGLEATPISNSGTNAWGNGNTTPSLQSASGLTNSTSGKNFGTNSLPSTGEASTGWLGALGAFLLTSLGSLLFWRKKQ
ncbi:adhesive domain-containing protein [Lactococcus taiwanensis]|uniref:adhesive domain-containing protein n=1 Tax=Lactococcus taiwanensis TaxID=1151742 RepID=UPI001963F8E3|nr:adhesive domain-containing protein [Lactococcus taiwanensis]QRZ11522.1 LPXTG cell wall anchor domain-containing protein [Lactococcus taiwanensis]